MSLDVIADIKDRLPLMDYVQRDLKLTKQGATYVGCCPFHAEKTGSFTIWPRKDNWHCFGCGANGDIFTYYQRRFNVEFKDALRALAREAGVQLVESPERQEAVRKLRERGEILAVAAKFYHEQLRAEHRAYLAGRGFKPEFQDEYQFGYAPGDCIRQALKDAPLPLLQDIGLMTKPEPPQTSRDFLWRRIIIPVYGRDGSVVNLVGRRWVEPGEEDDGPRKYLRLPGDEQLINEQALRGAQEVYLCEGDTDTPTLVQAGLSTVGVPGASALKDEYLDKFKHVETVFCCADPDAAGDGLRHRAGQMFGSRCRIIDLPDGQDVNKFVGVNGGDIAALAAKARPYLEWLTDRMPAELPPDQADAILEPVLAALAHYGKAAQDLYSKKLAKRFGVNLASFREAIREREQKTMNGHDKNATKLGASRIVWKMPRLVNPAQDLVDGTMLTTVFLDVLEEDPETKTPKPAVKPHVVNSKREVFPLTEADMWQRGWRFAATKLPAIGIVGRRWTTEETAEYSVKAYLDNKTTVNPWEVYQDVVGYFRAFLDYPNDGYYDLIALWTVGTYFFNLYQTYPYLHLTGAKRVGKSRTLNLIAEMGFNTLWSASMTAAAAYRSIESCSATLLLDEAENLRERTDKDKDDSQNDKMEILKAGYQKGQTAIRCSGEDNQPTGYDLYSPKVFGGTQGLDPILEDRVITLVLARRTKELPEFILSEQQPVLHKTRHKLFILMLDYATNVAEEIKAGIGWDGVQDRERELWTPILTLAQFIDAARLEEHPDLTPAELLTFRMRQMATQISGEKLAHEQSEQIEPLLLEAVLEFLNTAEPANKKDPSWYLSSTLFGFVRQKEGLFWRLTSATRLTRELEKVTAIDGKRDLKRVDVEGKRARAIRLERNRIAELARRYGANVT